MLTPLVDVMFLLLIFFMVSSQTSPYSLLTMQAGKSGSEPSAQAAPTPPPKAVPATPQVRVTVYNGYVRYNGLRVELTDLKASVDKSRAAGALTAVVLSSTAATVQDVVSVVDALRSADFADVQLVMQSGGAS